MTQRVECKSNSCQATILPATAARTDGYCMPCVQAAQKRERDEFIRLNRRDVDAFNGVSDPVGVLKTIHAPRVYDPLVNWIPYPIPTDEVYLSLSTDEQRRLATYAESLIGPEKNKVAEDILRCLAAFTDSSLDGILRALVAHESFWPSIAFVRSPVDVRDELIARVNWDEENRNHILLALAWIGDQVVVDLFMEWERHPPVWSSLLFVPPAS